MGIKHAFTSPKSDPADATLVRPTNWNADHTVAGNTIAIGGSNLVSGTGNPEGSVAATVGSIFMRSDGGGPASTLYVKTTGSGSTGWSVVSVTPGAAPPTGNLQAAINAATAGGTVDATGGTYTGPVTINKALTLIGGTINCPAGVSGINVTANNVTIDGTTIAGAGITGGGEIYGIMCQGTSGAWRTGLTIRNTTITNFAWDGIFFEYVNGFTIYHNVVNDIKYGAIVGRVVTNGTITFNTVRRIDTNGGAGDNAYGIAALDFGTAGEFSHDVTIADNIVSDNEWWEGIETHNGRFISFLRNDVRRCSVNLEITKAGSGSPANCTVTGNYFAEPTTYRAQGGHPVILYGCATAAFTDNVYVGFGAESPPANAPWFDFNSLSTNLTAIGNTVTP